jgi:hypothetical protein
MGSWSLITNAIFTNRSPTGILLKNIALLWGATAPVSNG